MSSILLYKDCTIQKKLLSGGKGDVPQFVDGSKVAFHYQTQLCDDDRTVLDNSHEYGKPLELYIGKKFKLEVWETCIKSMRLNEVASFTVPASAVSCYPLVAKSLRDIGKGKCVKQTSHCCGNALQTLGYPDLDKLLKKPQAMLFILELVKVEDVGDFNKDIWAMSDEEKLVAVPKLREEGNALYKEKRYEEAGTKYAEAIGILEQLILKERPGDDVWLKLEDDKVPLLLNYSQCSLLAGDYYQVIEHTTEVLKRQPDNVKALFRRAHAHIEVWNPDEARDDYKKVLELDNTLTNAVNAQLHILRERERDKHLQDKAKYQGKMFQ